MANANQTSPAFNHPRPPNAAELSELADWLQTQGHESDVAQGLAAEAYVAVYDQYQTWCPGYCGKVMTVVWDGAPSFFDVFTWEDGQMVRSGRDYDEKACDRCGATNASLCVTCWWSYAKSRGWLGSEGHSSYLISHPTDGNQ
jgi:hypothetical protein